MSGPGVGEVWLYKDAKFQGHVWKFNDSCMNFDDVGCNNKASSIRVGPGTTAILYKDSKFKGDILDFNTDSSNLGKFNDAASSMQILKDLVVGPPVPQPGEVYLYRDGNFESFVWRLNHDLANVKDIGAEKKISSVRVGPGNEVLLYNEPGFKGKVMTVSGGVANLGDFNDKVASVKIMRK